MQWSLVLPVPTVDRPWSGLVAPLRLEDGHAVEIKLLNMDLSAKVSGFPYVTCSGTLYLAEVTFDGTSITLSGTDDTRFVPEEPMQPHGWHRVKELCAGLGGIGYGLQFLQAVICASVEINDLACSQLAHNLHGEIIQGDICQDQTILACHLAGGTSPALLTAGFPCQPFSSQGDQKAFADERTKPFWAILRATILTRATGLILECVPQAGRNSVIIDSLQEVARLLHWQVHPVQLSLSDVWPSSRTRWWCLLLPQALGDPELRSWHADGHGACINKVLEDWPIWDEADERELELTAFEIDKYFDSSLGPDQRILDMNKTCPTALHSYGNALQHCPCGCRPPFRADRLERAGLRGFCVKSKRTGNLRFLHPNELSYLLSYAPAADFVRPCRAALCLLGQIAAPAQALWVYAHACRTFEMHQNGFATTDPQASLDSFRQRLSCQKHDYWTFSSSLSTSAVELVDADGTAIPCTRQGLTHVGHLLAAEESSTSWGYMPKLYDGSRLVPSDAVLQLQGLFGPYVLLRVAKAQPKPAPTGLLAIAIDIPEHFHIALVPVGTFLFEVLHDFGLSGVPSLQDDFGHTLLPGHRLWHSTRLMLSASVAAPILSVADTPCLRPDISVSSAHSLGFGQHGLGLCIDFVWDAAHFLLDQFELLCPDRRSNTRIGIVRTHPGQAMYFDYGESFIARPRPRNTYYWMVLEDEHWYLIVCYLEGSQFDPVHHAATFYIYDGLRHGVLPDSAQRLIHLVECMWFYPVEEVYHAGILEQTRTDSCGTLMLGHLVHALGLCRDPCLDHIEDLHPGLAFLSAAYPLQRLGFGPSSANSEGRLQHELELLLLDKGVPHARVAERAAMAIQKIGVAGLQEALSRPNAWAALKSLGSRPHANFMFVKSDELQDKIRQRAAAKFKIQPSTKKARQGTSVNSKPSLQVEPDHLSLIPGTFAADDKEVSQISFAEVGQDKTGLAFCHAVDIQPYLIEGKPISTQALGVLTITPVPTELRGLLAVVDLRYPALCTATSEPMLISGSLINLGQVPIGRLGVTNPPQVAAIKTQTLKLTVYKDQWPDDWTQFIDKPFRLLLAKFPRLQLCRSTGCGDGCAFYHPPVDEVLDSLILDLWGRNWHLDNGKYTKPEQASYWSILIRVPHYAHLTVQGLSGTHGLYCEPRTHGGKEVDPTFSIVWLNNVGLQQILHRAKTTAKVVAIHRLQQKYGLRFAEADFAEAHKLLKPEEPYVHSRTTSIYKLFPLPLGTQRQGLQRALLQWGWKARVLQPVAGSVDGTTWEVGAAQEPPSRVLQSADGDVMVTFLRHTIKDPAPAPIVASSSTRDHFKQLSMAKDDPWLGQSDPWKAYRSTTSSTAAPSTDKLKQMEERLRADLHSAVHAPSAAPQGMHVDSEDSGLLQSHQLQSESRLHALEVDMEEIKNSNQQFRVWFQQAADQNQELQTHVASVQAVVEQQQRDFDQLRSDMAVHTSSTQEQMNVLRGEVREEFSNGFSRIEAMLEKKARTS
ncbi:Cytosine-specific methyltransferase NlaX (M.NlaX) [Durusdinium trenchii]|uniref:Cytosine-specific methyltransferase NlaX (M.NlaX) n=1 Tax=Durusdinium trenchii TaxID=1381693 RepID=A0ABP0MX70_9DINO